MQGQKGQKGDPGAVIGPDGSLLVGGEKGEPGRPGKQVCLIFYLRGQGTVKIPS